MIVNFISLLGYFVWDPDRIFFTIPKINHPIAWYGVLFTLGFLGGYYIVKKMIALHFSVEKTPEETKKITALLSDRITFFAIIGTLIGARLGHVFFYDWPLYSQYPLEIIKIWEGGLSSHGSAVGIAVSLYLFTRTKLAKTYQVSMKMLLDVAVVAAAFAGGFIRVGNFMNQEILGTPSTLPWAVAFLHPMEGPAGVPLHPVQLYEALFYFLSFGILMGVWKKTKTIGTGLLTGTFFILIFTFRFFIEFLKLPQSQWIDESLTMNMGQWLSIPFIALGVYFLVHCYKQKSLSNIR